LRNSERPQTIKSFTAENSTQENTLSIRGTSIPLPFKIRVQIKEISSFSNEATRGFEISGQELIADGYRSLGKNSRLSCSIYRNPMALLNTSPFDPFPAWVCRGKNFQKILLNSSMKISTGSGFLKIGKHEYRGELEIINRDATLKIVNPLDMEPYLEGLVNAEINSSFADEAIKAQVVAARSYALATAADRRKTNSVFDVYSTDDDQMYSGSLLEDSRAFQMVKAVSGEVLFHLNNVLKSYYHSHNGGYSELPQNVWGKEATTLDERAYTAASIPIDANAPEASWSAILGPKQGLSFGDLGEIRKISVLSRSEGKRVRSLMIYGTRTRKVISGIEFRNRLGPRFIKSTFFTVSKVPEGFLIEGRGWGHGVGLSQWGAEHLAKKGMKYRDILKTYYPFANIGRLLQLESSTPKEAPKKSSLQIQAR
jgi:stage II sporulation protein D